MAINIIAREDFTMCYIYETFQASLFSSCSTVVAMVNHLLVS